ncbi:hypothetical protein EDB19DRAFT_1830959 [Suillus lakei]|nr:hypothetical protein EDB19DRAFT_1830959 [Suillus lakei]
MDELMINATGKPEDRENSWILRRETGAKSDTSCVGERDRDKKHIGMEVRMLKAKLSYRHPQTQIQVPIPLSPPPGVRVPLPPHLSESKALFASAHPTEASTTWNTNNLAKLASGKARQHTINVPSDKMAMFLNEMRTVRLRKVGPVPTPWPGGRVRVLAIDLGRVG